MELNFKLDLDVAADAAKGGRITTGVYTVEIVHAEIGKTENGNNIVDLEVRSENGEIGFINQICIDEFWASGTENSNYRRWQELAACAQMQSLTVYAYKKTVKGVETEVQGIKELVGRKVRVAVYEEFDVYNNKEQIRLRLQNTFLPDGRSVAEAQAKKPAARIFKLEERLKPFYTEDWTKWKAMGGITETAATTPQAPTMETRVAPPLETLGEANLQEEDDLFG